jgi:UDPglucose--hexose-1-phosphate uridylyltransferase
MADFSFLFNLVAQQWTILAPRRSKRPNSSKGTTSDVCPFCIGQETSEEELYRLGGKDHDSDWEVRVTTNKFPFAPSHEIIIHSPDHHKNFDELPLDQVEKILRVFRDRYAMHQEKGQVLIFHNHGEAAGESLPHPHTQLVVISHDVKLSIEPKVFPEYPHETDYFQIFSPTTAKWPDEVWIIPKRNGTTFGEIMDEELTNLAMVLQRSIQLLDMRHGDEFPFNFYITPGKNWYLKLIPRLKIIGGFEVATNIFVNTQDPAETNTFIKARFDTTDIEEKEKKDRADYARMV